MGAAPGRRSSRCPASFTTCALPSTRWELPLRFPLAAVGKFGLHWIQPTAPLAHPLDDGTAVVLHRSSGTAESCWARWSGIPTPLRAVGRQPRHAAGWDARSARTAAASASARAIRLEWNALSGLEASPRLGSRLSSTRALRRDRRAFGDFLGGAVQRVVRPLAGHAGPRSSVAVPQGGSRAIAGALAGYLEFVEVAGGRPSRGKARSAAHCRGAGRGYRHSGRRRASAAPSPRRTGVRRASVQPGSHRAC